MTNLTNLAEAKDWTDPRCIADAIRACGLVPTLTSEGWGVGLPDDGLPEWAKAVFIESDSDDTPECVRWLELEEAVIAARENKKPGMATEYRTNMLRQFVETALPRATGETIPRGAVDRLAFDRACVMLALKCDGQPKPTLANVAQALALVGIDRVWRDVGGRVVMRTDGTGPALYERALSEHHAALPTTDALAVLRILVMCWFYFDPGKARVRECLEMALAWNSMRTADYYLAEAKPW